MKMAAKTAFEAFCIIDFALLQISGEIYFATQDFSIHCKYLCLYILPLLFGILEVQFLGHDNGSYESSNDVLGSCGPKVDLCVT